MNGLILSFLLNLFAFGSEAVEPLKLRNTHYYVALESEYDGLPKTATLLDMNEKVLAQVSPEFKRAVTIEGTGRLSDGRIVNFAGRKNGEIRWLITKAPYGLGVGTCKLRPFRSVAVDPEVVPLGSVIKIQETIGMRLPGGRRHNGIWHAIDIGGAIKKDRIDLFVGDGDRGDFLRRAGITNLLPLTVEIVTPPAEDSCVASHKPSISTLEKE